MSFLLAQAFGGVHDNIPWAQISAPAAKAKRRVRAKKTIHATLRSILVDRLEAAVDANVIDLLADSEPVEQVAITLGEYALLLAILLPEEYREPQKKPKPTKTAPASASRIETYQGRVEKGQTTFAPADARADGAGRGLKVEQRGNGTGPRVLGWEDEED